MQIVLASRCRRGVVVIISSLVAVSCRHHLPSPLFSPSPPSPPLARSFCCASRTRSSGSSLPWTSWLLQQEFLWCDCAITAIHIVTLALSCCLYCSSIYFEASFAHLFRSVNRFINSGGLVLIRLLHQLSAANPTATFTLHSGEVHTQ